jgi:purine-nucleoside phosphorylase
VRAAAELGVGTALFTNAAGGCVREWPPGSLMRITDHLDLQHATPLFLGEGGRGTPWDAALGEQLDAAARGAGIALERGVYAALPGPSYETPAEVRFLADFGAQAVGMSTAQEAVAAHAAGMRVAGISCITNHAAGIAPGALSHAEVMEVGARAGERFGELLAAALPLLVAPSG